MWKYMMLVAVFCAVYQLWKRSSVEDLIAIDKCPFCFGKSLCSSVSKGRLSIGKPKSATLWEHYDSLFRGAKNVFYGMLDMSQQIILKNLGHDWELKELDDAGDQLMSTFGVLDWNELSAESLISEIVDKVTGNFTAPGIKLMLCVEPSVNDTVHRRQVLDKLFEKIAVDSDFDVKNGGTAALLHIWSLINLNPEPIILQLFPSQGGWPIPEYLGACGRLVAEEYCGESLSSVAHNLSWSKKALIASQAITAVHRFTHGDSLFRLYLADISADNLAVMEDENGIRLTFVDLEDSILVEKTQPHLDESNSWSQVHISSSFDDCDDGSCFSFSNHDICSHFLSDHNHYALCHQLLGPSPIFADGLLEPYPENIKQNEHFPQLKSLIKECIKPSVDHQSREDFALELQQLLEHLAYYA